MQRLSRLAIALLTSTETAEVFNRLGDEVGIEFHCDAAGRLAANGNVKKDTRSS